MTKLVFDRIDNDETTDELIGRTLTDDEYANLTEVEIDDLINSGGRQLTKKLHELSEGRVVVAIQILQLTTLTLWNNLEAAGTSFGSFDEFVEVYSTELKEMNDHADIIVSQ
jgi:hypothetical protein